MSDADKVNILIVDDLPEKLLVLESVLEGLGTIVAVRSGEDALRRVLEQDFAVILLDVNMPGMDGFETAELIRRRKKSAHTPIIFVTAFADEIRLNAGYELGAVDYILTPVIPPVLRAKVGVFVDLFRMTQQVRRQAEARIALAREQAARSSAEDATRRSAFLAEASKVLGSSLDPRATLRGLAWLSVPTLADLALTIGIDEFGTPTSPEVAWLSPVHEVVMHVARPEELPARLSKLVSDATSASWPEVIHDIPPDPTAVVEKGCPAGPLLILPLVARNRKLGIMILARDLERTFGPADRALAEDLASRAAIALDNSRLYQNIQENDRRKDEFLAMLAHELRNPLGPLCNAVEILRRIGLDNVEAPSMLSMITRQVTHMSRLIDDLLDVSRLSRGKILLRKERIDLAGLVRTTVEDYRPSLEKSGLRLEVRLPEHPVYMEGDPTRLAQVVGNVLHNTNKFTDQGGLVQVELAVNGERRSATLTICDTGIGMEPEMLRRVFDAFSQADRSLDRSRGGLGLGLTLVKGLTEMHGGEVSVASEGPGKGTTLTIKLPAQGRSTTPAQAAASPLNGPRRRILVIEDNRDAAESMRQLLALAGHEVAVALTGIAGVETAGTFKPEVVLCDIGLPGGMDGYGVARALTQGTDPPNYLIAISGYGQLEDQRQAYEAGFHMHLTKPVDFRDLQRHLAAIPIPARSASEEPQVSLPLQPGVDARSWPDPQARED
jgi:signal transduction histidine kinase/DNA-binding response OmpR family regulator